jgi:uncharacterized protein YjbI with pentapeptide repeats
VKKTDKSVQNNLQETITKALLDALKIPSPPKGLCPVDYPFLPLQYPTLQDESKKPSARIYCSRKLYKDTKYCYWHIKDKNKYLQEEISNYFGENITLKEAIEREVAKRNPLGAAYLVDADLGSNYQGKGCNLQGGYFMSANFSGAKLSNSNLNGAIFSLANLEYAYLSACNIDDTIFHGAKLFNTKFRNMNFNAYNSLKKDNFRSEKWGFFPIYRMLEDYPDQCEEMYRKLASYFADQGLFDDASWASFRSGIMRHRILTKRLSRGNLKGSLIFEKMWSPGTDNNIFQIRARLAVDWVITFLAWCRSLFLRITMGYGEKPLRALANAICVIISYAAIYFHFGAVKNDTTFLGSLYFSMTTFTTLGYGDMVPNIPFRLLAASEAMSGILLTGMFLFCLGRRSVGRS